MIDDALYTFLTGQSTITDLVSTRIYPDELPENPTYPAITVSADQHFGDDDYDGDNGFAQSDYFFDAWAYDRDDAKSIADALRTLFKGHQGMTGGIYVHRVHLQFGPICVFEDSVKAYRMTQTFAIWHNQA